MKKLAIILPIAFLFSGCTLFPSSPITGTEQQKAEKLSQIISSGGQANCKVTNLTDNTSTQISVSGKKMKIVGSDFGEGKQGTMINDGTYTYIWTEGEKVGFKSKLEAEKPLEPTENLDRTAPVDSAKQVDTFEDETKFKMDCTRGGVSDADFTPPADVQFTDFSEMLKTVPTIPAR
ncbi:TPA: hypothetical protein DIU27_03425 [Candidatus Collierbacteria bacterium]|uniref:Lipoprotein n=1 Tax=Candidatus Collierbacteria bacterium GW2011_GWB2_44_22 TaxID=1618387 RepID=A0A0G1KWF0_9BACT|nr:MAG: hypothetical protein UW31_C0007G0007 [Candidatus Collierbacteria bacterium GW2011_GWA2_44_13]KKT50009.1 MAG: hypothetical protein UW42_C0026G0004 [Candidatus Collierbacteria bacterium GW2011_GWB1_44_197]KKT52239.1 MAG: hypothetical protein UW44_C0003G0082 [Candidatus Collierbacteria bacterium GW2011_GWB2_44_22]KKT62397.1 MAG: hypothetical protein UW56_C0007G0005 [Candidatus Collierbacteria bacterium GW2011_GWD1_44_27]KKT66819.1 MAG: hypothetical protein UW58_C0002G0004 [Candidatus Colli